MSRSFKCGRPTLGVVVALIVAVGVSIHSARSHSSPFDGEVAAIKVVLDKQEADWNKGDLDAFLEGYWHSPGVVFLSGGDRNDGFDAMRERYRKRYKAEGREMGKVAFSGVEIMPLSADSAFVRGRWGLTMPDGKTPGGLFTLIFRKFPEGWKIIHDHTSVAEPAPASKPAPAGP